MPATIRRTATAPVLSEGDLIFTHLGRTFGIEVTEIKEANFVTLLELSAGKWGVPQSEIPNHLNINLEWISNQNIANSGGPMAWISNTFIPWLNALLAAIFKPQALAATTEIEQVATLLGTKVLLTPKSDGTITASIKP